MKECSLWLAGRPMAELCREFGISRKTGYKIFDLYQDMRDSGADRPEPTSFRFQVENYILNVKREHPS